MKTDLSTGHYAIDEANEQKPYDYRYIGYCGVYIEFIDITVVVLRLVISVKKATCGACSAAQ